MSYLEAASVAVRGREVEGRHSGGVLVHGHVGLPLEQALHDLGVAVLGGQVQGGAAIRVCEFTVSAQIFGFPFLA